MADVIVPQISGPIYSSGAGLSNSLQQILARKKMEARQVMLDQIMREQNAAELEERRARTDAYAEAQKATADWRRSQMDKDWASAFDIGDAAPSEEELNQHPTVKHLFKRQAKTQPGVETGIVFPEGPGTDDAGNPVELTEEELVQTAPKAQKGPEEFENVFQGFPEQREEARGRQLLSYLQGNPQEWKSMNKLQRYALLRMIDPKGTISDKILEDEAQSETFPLIVLDRKGQPRIAGYFPKGAQVRQEPAPPSAAGGSGSGKDEWVETTIEDPTSPSGVRTILRNKYDPSRPSRPILDTEGNEVGGAARRTAPPFADPNRPLINNQAWNEFVDAAQSRDSRVRATARLRRDQVIGTANTTPRVRTAATGFLNATNPQIIEATTDELLKSGIDLSGWTVKEIKDLRTLLMRIRNK